MQSFQPDIHPRLPQTREMGIGIIGVGSIVQYGHMPAYRKAGFPVAGIASRNEASVLKTASDWNIPRAFTDWRKLLDLPEVHVVDITYPFDEERLEIVREAAIRGKHIMMQKPLAHSLDAAEEMVKICDENHVLLAVNQNARWSPQYRAARMAISQGLLGEVYFLIHEMQNTQDSQEWFQQKWYASQPRFQIMEYAVHHIDLARFWMGQEPTRVTASIARKPGQQAVGEMIASINLEFPNNTLGIIVDDNASYPRAEPHSHFRIEGTRGIVEGEAMGQAEFTIQSDLLNGERQSIPLDGQWFPDGFIGTMGELLCAIEENRQPEISGRDNLNTLRIVFAAYDSLSI